MDKRLLGKKILLALEGEFVPYDFSPRWFVESGFFTEEEANGREWKVSRGRTAFEIKKIRFECTRSKLLISGKSLSELALITSIMGSVIDFRMFKKLEKVVFVEQLISHFLSKDDAVTFGDHYMPLNLWDDKLNIPRVFEFTIGGKADEANGIPRTIVNVRSLGGIAYEGETVTRLGVVVQTDKYISEDLLSSQYKDLVETLKTYSEVLYCKLFEF